MTNVSGLLALPLLHHRERYGRPKSELQRLCIFIVTLLLDCSLPVAPGDSSSTLAILVASTSLLVGPSCSWSFVVVVVFVFVVVVVVVFARSYVFGCCYFTLGLRVPPAATRSTVFSLLQVKFYEISWCQLSSLVTPDTLGSLHTCPGSFSRSLTFDDFWWISGVLM